MTMTSSFIPGSISPLVMRVVVRASILCASRGPPRNQAHFTTSSPGGCETVKDTFAHTVVALQVDEPSAYNRPSAYSIAIETRDVHLQRI